MMNKVSSSTSNIFIVFEISKNHWVPNPLQALGTKFALKKSSPSGGGFFHFFLRITAKKNRLGIGPNGFSFYASTVLAGFLSRANH